MAEDPSSTAAALALATEAFLSGDLIEAETEDPSPVADGEPDSADVTDEEVITKSPIAKGEDYSSSLRLPSKVENITRQSTPELIILISEYMYYSMDPISGESSRVLKKQLSSSKMDDDDDDHNHDHDHGDDDDGHDSGSFFLPKDLSRLIHAFLLLRPRVLDDFELVKVVGRGSFGKVFAIWDRSERRLLGKDKARMYAMKVLDKKSTVERHQIRHSIDELRFYQMIAEEGPQCPFLVRMYSAFETETRLCFVLDFYDGGELFHHLREHTRFPESTACVIVAEMTAALMHLHDKFDIVHRNLKPEVVMLQREGHCVLIDCGLSKQIPNGERAHTFCGTPEYLAPELVSSDGHGKPVDWWAVGTLLYELIVGIPPFYDQNVMAMYEKIRTGDLRFPAKPRIRESTHDLITKLLNRNPAERLGTVSTDEIKEHPFWIELAPGKYQDSKDFWHQLSGLQVIPPFKPKPTKSDAFSNFDQTFLDEAVVLTPKPNNDSITQRFRESAEDKFEYF